MKLNWGHKLTIGMISFMAFIVLLITLMMKQKVDMVETNYYERGIKYQDEINSKKEADKLMEIKYDNRSLYLRMHNNDEVNGTIVFYRPSDENKDFEISFRIEKDAMLSVPVDAIDKGLWNIKVNWNDKQGAHLIEKKLEL